MRDSEFMKTWQRVPMNFWVAGTAVWLALSVAAHAEVRLPNVIGSNMVLQRDRELTLWGWADPGEEVTVKLGAAAAKSAANRQGEWKVKLPAQQAGGPHTVTIAGKNTIELTNVLVGEVWLASGQSNMEMSLFRTDSRVKNEVGSAKYPTIRLFNVAAKKTAAILPQENVDPAVVWTECSPETATSFSAVAYYFGKYIHKELGVPVGLINSSWGSTRIEPWTPPVGFAMVDDPAIKAIGEKQARQVATLIASGEDLKAAVDQPPKSPVIPFVIYNGSIHPLAPFPIRGVVWYQGESNLGDGMAYAKKMEALIKGWRSAWGQGDFPFLFVQLAPYRKTVKEFILQEIWEAQTAVLRSVENTGLCVTTDIGNLDDIHPVNKDEVGRRLALWALAKTYGRTNLVYSGPIYKSMKIEGSKIRLEFEYVGEGLASRDGQPLTWFQVAADTGDFVNATAVIDGSSVVVSSDQVAKATAVRFGWDKVAQPNLINKDGLPASPFRTGR